jgi:hypothetical protein
VTAAAILLPGMQGACILRDQSLSILQFKDELEVILSDCI